MSNSRNACRGVAAGAIGAGMFAGALVAGAAAPAQATPGTALSAPPAAVQVTDAPLAIGSHLATDQARGNTVLATDLRTAPMPQWWGHHWGHHWWHHWWWWW